MLEKAYSNPDSINTTELYRELSARTGVEQKKLKTIFATFYDIVSESIVEENKKTVHFDNALTFKATHIPEEVTKKDNGDLEIHPEKLNVSVKLGKKIKYRIIDLFNRKKEFP